MFRLKYVIRQALENNIAFRDNDNLLISYVIKLSEGNNIKKMSASELLESIESGKYGTLESVRRARQKWQEQDESLRGEKWEERHENQREVREQLKFW